MLEASEALNNPGVLKFLTLARVGRLATVASDGAPHNIPLCFCLVGGRFYFIVDEKPKRETGRRLKRVRNMLHEPRVGLVVDHYEEDWSGLAYVLIHGAASLVEEQEEYMLALRALRDKYPQYREMALRRESNLMVRIDPQRIHFWGRRFSPTPPAP